MPYLTSFKSSTYAASTLPTLEAIKQKRRVGVSRFYRGATSSNTLLAGTALYGLAGTVRGKDPDQRNY